MCCVRTGHRLPSLIPHGEWLLQVDLHALLPDLVHGLISSEFRQDACWSAWAN